MENGIDVEADPAVVERAAEMIAEEKTAEAKAPVKKRKAKAEPKSKEKIVKSKKAEKVVKVVAEKAKREPAPKPKAAAEAAIKQVEPRGGRQNIVFVREPREADERRLRAPQCMMIVDLVKKHKSIVEAVLIDKLVKAGLTKNKELKSVKNVYAYYKFRLVHAHCIKIA